MKKTFSVAITLALFALYIAYFIAVQPSYASYPGLHKGEIFISDNDFYSSNQLFLTGDWEFYFGELTESGGFDAKEQKNYYYLPDYWQREWNDIRVETNGYGSYRVQIVFETQKDTVTLSIPWIFGAYEVYANDKGVLKCGSVGTEHQREIPDIRSQIVAIPLESNKLELVIHVSGHISGLSGLLHPIAIGSDTSVLQYNAIQIARDAIFIGCFLIMGFYHIAMFFFRKKDKATLCFALLMVAAMLRQGTISYGLLYSVLPINNGFLAYDTYILSNIWLVAMFGIFSYYLFGKKYNVGKKNILFLVAFSIIDTVVVLVRTYGFSYLAFYLGYACFITCIIFMIRILFLVNRHKEKYAFLYTHGAIFLLLANGSDILMDFGVTGSGDVFGNTSYVVFAFIETVILARMCTDFSHENERLLMHMEALVDERTAELAGANKRLLLMEQAKNELISNISHDLRTPMTAIKGYMELLMESDLHGDTVRREYIESAHARTGQMENLIKDLFFLTQLVEKSTPTHISTMEIAEFLTDCYRNYRLTAEQKGIDLILKDYSCSKTMRADRNFLLRIMDNLMQNALCYAKSSIIITAKVEDGTVVLSITDDGEGIDKESLPHVFDRFFKKRLGGAGLGLCIVKELATTMGAEAFANSIPNERTEFGIKFAL